MVVVVVSPGPPGPTSSWWDYGVRESQGCVVAEEGAMAGLKQGVAGEVGEYGASGRRGAELSWGCLLKCWGTWKQGWGVQMWRVLGGGWGADMVRPEEDEGGGRQRWGWEAVTEGTRWLMEALGAEEVTGGPTWG